MGNVTLVSTDPQEVVERVLQVPEKKEETSGEVAEESAETAAESQTAVESTDEADGDEESEHKPSKRSQKVKRLAEKLTAEESRRAAVEKERDEWRAKYENKQAGREEQPKASESKFPPYPVPKPKMEDFKDPMECVEATAAWSSDKRDYERSQESEFQKKQSALQEAKANHLERVEEARDKYDDWDDVIKAAPDIEFKHGDVAISAFYAAIAESEDGPEIMYYLAQHPEVADEFYELTPGAAAAKVGRIAAKLPASEDSPEVKKAASRHINPVGGGSKRPDVPNDTSKMPFREWQRLRKAGKIR